MAETALLTGRVRGNPDLLSFRDEIDVINFVRSDGRVNRAGCYFRRLPSGAGGSLLASVCSCSSRSEASGEPSSAALRYHSLAWAGSPWKLRMPRRFSTIGSKVPPRASAAWASSRSAALRRTSRAAATSPAARYVRARARRAATSSGDATAGGGGGDAEGAAMAGTGALDAGTGAGGGTTAAGATAAGGGVGVATGAGATGGGVGVVTRDAGARGVAGMRGPNVDGGAPTPSVGFATL